MDKSTLVCTRGRLAMGIQLNPLGRERQPVISKNRQCIAIGNTNQIDIYDSDINLVRSVSVPGKPGES